MEIIFLLVGITVGVLAGWLFARYQHSSSTQNTSSVLFEEQGRVKELTGRLAELKAEVEKERRTVIELNSSLSTTEADYRNLQEKLKDQEKELNTLQEKFTIQFENLANKIFDEKSKKFTEQNKSNMSDILKPLGEKITDFEKKIDTAHKESIEKNAGLFNELKNLKSLNVQMSEDAKNLTRALKGDTKAQGNWGEFILESILEKSGLERGREYSVQESFTSPEGRRQQPDVIVKLPEDRHIIIDSKVSLTAYNLYVNTEGDQERTAYLKQHLQSMRQHMRILADKEYQKNYSDNGLDFVIMFVPIEPAYLLAIQNENSLYEEAFEKRIVLVSPTLLQPSLQLIKSAWKQEYQNRHALEIANKAGNLYDKFVAFTDDLVSLGRYLNNTRKSYEDAMNKLTTGSGNLVRRTEELKKLGAKAGKAIDQKLLTRAEDQADLFE
jgi:DNA recombination protein RmuC